MARIARVQSNYDLRAILWWNLPMSSGNLDVMKRLHSVSWIWFPFSALADGTLQLMLIAHNLLLLVQILRITL